MSGLSNNSNIKVVAGSSFEQLRDARVEEYRAKWRENPLSHRVEQFPIHLDLESTSVCNLKCPFCAGTHTHYAQGFMPIELFRRIIDEGSEKGLYSVKLNFRGEPLLHPEIHRMVRYAKDRGIVDVFFNTNATMLSEEVARRLIDAGLDRLIVSFEGVSAPVYQANRVGADFGQVVSQVRRLAQLKRELSTGHPALRLQTVELDGEKEYLAAYRTFWDGVADEITCIDLRDESRDYSFLTSNAWECPYPWLRLLVTWQGQVLTCPFVNHAEDSYDWQGLGSLERSSIEEIWQGDEMQRIRAMHREKLSHTGEPCRRCSYRGTELSKETPGGER